jgi:glycosyltransferase involved in cell wall biosynthesis
MKGCQELIEFFMRFSQQMPDVDLVLIGKPAMDIPEHPRLHALGFVSEPQKTQAIQQATVVVNPSEYESLSLLILEAWQQGAPVLVNGRSDVLAGHCIASNGGLHYTNYDEFALCLNVLLRQPELRHTLGQQGQFYVQQHYSWDTIEKTYVDFITQIGNT